MAGFDQQPRVRLFREWQTPREILAPAGSGMNILCFTADDYGMDPGIDRGILATLDAGLVRNVSVWVDVPESSLSEQAVERLRNADIGLHLDLVPDQIDLTRLRDWPGALSRLFPTRANLEHHRQRLERAVTRLTRAGLTVRFVNGHQHIHLLPGWCEWLSDWAVREGMTWFRQPVEPGPSASRSRRRQPKLVLLEFLGRRAARCHRRTWWFPAVCRWGCGFSWTELLAEVATCPDTGLEIVVHPGYPDQEFLRRTGSPVNGARQADLLQDRSIEAQLRRLDRRPATLSEWAATAGF